MFSLGAPARSRQTAELNELRALAAAMNRSSAVIEFDLDGVILSANTNFLATMGYAEDEVVGRKHNLFVAPDYAQSAAYRDFWAALRRGEFLSDKFLRYGKNGRRVWIQASYNPMFDAEGRPYKVVRSPTAATAGEEERERLQAAQHEAQIGAQQTVCGALAAGLSALAEGDLRARIDRDFPEAYAELKRDFNTALDRLSEAMGAIVGVADQLGVSTGEISHASDDLSRRTEQQAASLEETAAALDEITATVRPSAEGARRARDAVAATR